MRRAIWMMTVILALVAASGCQGSVSSSPPIHLNPNMDQQDRYDPQEPSTFFADGRSMRPQVAGTVARGHLNEDDHYFRGKAGETFFATMPAQVTVDAALLARGQARFNIYCLPCHDAAGTGQGIVAKRGMIPPPPFTMDRLIEMPVGQIYDLITNGVRNMPSYGAQIPVADRWAIVAYVRALQLAGHAPLSQVPADVAASKGWSK